MDTMLIPFLRLLQDPEGVIIETGSGRYRMHGDIGERYIMSNLAVPLKTDGMLCARLGQVEGELRLMPVAVIPDRGRSTDQVTWVVNTRETPDDIKRYPVLTASGQAERLKPLLTESGDEYPDGFIDHTRTALSHDELTAAESRLSTEEYARQLHRHYAARHPGQPYDARLHYPMIKGIRKHYHYAEDFSHPHVNPRTWYHGWSDPFPESLLLATFGTIGSFPSYAKLRMLVDNFYATGDVSMDTFHLAKKVWKSKKSSPASRHYAAALLGLDNEFLPQLEEMAAKEPSACNRALLRVYAVTNQDKLHALLLENARRVTSGTLAPDRYGTRYDDWLDDPQPLPDAAPFRGDQTIAHRGLVALDALNEAQVRELCALYLPLIQSFDRPQTKQERCCRANAVRSFLVALSSSETRAAQDFFRDVFTRYPAVLYHTSASDAALAETDHDWIAHVTWFARENGLLADFFEHMRNSAYADDRTDTCSGMFLATFTRVAWHYLHRKSFYEVISPFIVDDYSLIIEVSKGLTLGSRLPDDTMELDYRWELLLFGIRYYAFEDYRDELYALIRHRIEPRPEGAGWDGVFPAGSHPELSPWAQGQKDAIPRDAWMDDEDEEDHEPEAISRIRDALSPFAGSPQDEIEEFLEFIDQWDILENIADSPERMKALCSALSGRASRAGKNDFRTMTDFFKSLDNAFIEQDPGLSETLADMWDEWDDGMELSFTENDTEDDGMNQEAQGLTCGEIADELKPLLTALEPLFVPEVAQEIAYEDDAATFCGIMQEYLPAIEQSGRAEEMYARINAYARQMAARMDSYEFFWSLVEIVGDFSPEAAEAIDLHDWSDDVWEDDWDEREREDDESDEGEMDEDDEDDDAGDEEDVEARIKKILEPFGGDADSYLEAVVEAAKLHSTSLELSLEERRAVLELGRLLGKSPAGLSFPEEMIAQANTIMLKAALAVNAAPDEDDDILAERAAQPYWGALCGYLITLMRMEMDGSATAESSAFLREVYARANKVFYCRESDAWEDESWWDDSGNRNWWLQSLCRFVEKYDSLENFYRQVDAYFWRMDRVGYYNRCYFYISLYGYLCLELLGPEEMHAKLAPLVESNFMFLTTFTKGFLMSPRLLEGRVKLAAAWRETFNRWVDDWEFDEAVDAFDRLREYFDLDPVPTRETFFYRFVTG